MNVIDSLKVSIKTLLYKENNPELAKQHGMVKQLWNDGEITCQKSGELLWQRTLHQFHPPCISNKEVIEELRILFPRYIEQSTSKGYCYIFFEHEEHIMQIRSMFQQLEELITKQ